MGLTEMTDMEENRNRDLGRRNERGRRGIKRADHANKRGTGTKDTIESSSLSTALIGLIGPCAALLAEP
jgi:hypothetical protein